MSKDKPEDVAEDLSHRHPKNYGVTTLLSSILSQAAKLPAFTFDKEKDDAASLADLAKEVLAARSEVSALVHADRFLQHYKTSDNDEKLAFFYYMLEELDIDAKGLALAAQKYAENQSPEHYQAIDRASKSKRLTLLNRLNACQSSTIKLVKMRQDLRTHLRVHSALKPVDLDMIELFQSWFNRGFLVLQPIDWSTPAHILEKIITYEAVHEIGSWDELRLRLAPTDRRCYAFFHLAMEDEPLIFVEVALTEHIPSSISALLNPQREAIEAEAATAAVFYSISNCQAGLAGISFGNFLIKQVAKNIQTELPNIKDFVTLSPLPNFADWVIKTEGGTKDLQTKTTVDSDDSDDSGPKKLAHRKEDNNGDGRRAVELLKELAINNALCHNESRRKEIEQLLVPLAAQYLLRGRSARGQVYDPVARFHLGNGARLERINYMGDTSPKAVLKAAGFMVNYYYDLSMVEQNHQAFIESDQIATSKEVAKLAPKIDKKDKK